MKMHIIKCVWYINKYDELKIIHVIDCIDRIYEICICRWNDFIEHHNFHNQILHYAYGRVQM